jgi:proteasome accessory factor B
MPKTAPKIQRWIDLLAALLRRHYPATFEELIRDVPAYGGSQSQDARRRMFERDKDELRGFGVPIETMRALDRGAGRKAGGGRGAGTG